MKHATIIRGSAAAAATALLAWALAAWAFGQSYYLAVLLPAAAFIHLIVAWFIHLGQDGFFRAPGRLKARSQGLDAPSAQEARRGPSTSASPAGEGDAVPLGLFAPREGLVSRGPEERGPLSEEASHEASGGARATRNAFLLAAAELALLATALYAFAGVGAHYFTER
jgi:hypothetical protein